MAVKSCPYCEHVEYMASGWPSTRFQGKVFDYVRCTQCGLVSLNPLLTDADIAALYAPEYHEMGDSDRRDFSAAYLVLQGAGIHSGRVLDFGCGNAEFLVGLPYEQFGKVGVEFDKSLVSTLRARHPDIHFIDTADFFDQKDLFDLIHLGDVLEHITDPKKLIDQLMSRLSPGGLFLIEGPLEQNSNLAYYARMISWKTKKKLNPNWIANHPPFHVTFADAGSQIRLFERLGLHALIYQLSEHPWPFPWKLEQVKSLKLLVFYLLGQISKRVSAVVPGWGNRFIFLGRKVEN